jgi:AcrR family transcriptional regulator
MTPARPKRPYHHGDLKDTLIDTALVHIARVGARALSLREVARRAGVSHTASYRHFSSKESLFAAIAEQGFRRLRDGMRAAMRAHDQDPVAALQATGVAYVEFGVRYPDHMQVMFGGLIERYEDYPALVAASKEAYELLVSIVSEGLRSGRLRGPDERIVALASWALVHGLSQLIAAGQIRSANGRSVVPRELAFATTSLLQQGIAITPAQMGRKAGAPTSGKTRAKGRSP